MKNFMFKFHLWLAQKLGFYVHEGLFGSSRARQYPQGRVLYHKKFGFEDAGRLSCEMPLGNCVHYASIFGGIVVPVDYDLSKASDDGHANE